MAVVRVLSPYVDRVIVANPMLVKAIARQSRGSSLSRLARRAKPQLGAHRNLVIAPPAERSNEP
ncbi:hypothetical protein [Mesorhizobium sp.]|nr:hypothetical protein [Mesorhizobium sp.]